MGFSNFICVLFETTEITQPSCFQDIPPLKADQAKREELLHFQILFG